MGALCQWTGGADNSMGGIWRTDAPPLQGEEIRHAFPDGGIERKRDLFAMPTSQAHHPSLLFFLLILFTKLFFTDGDS